MPDISQRFAPQEADFLIIGGGIAGASVGYWLAQRGTVVLLEAETQPGYHATGRSAALYMASYGNAQVRALTLASRAFFETPPDRFSDHPLLTPRGALMVVSPGQEAILEAHWKVLSALGCGASRLDASQTCDRIPVLRPEMVVGGLYEPDAADMDVHAIHQGFLRGIRRRGGSVVCGARVDRLQRDEADWNVRAAGQTWKAPVVVNAAGAWADEVARLAGAETIGLVPRRRSAFTFSPPETVSAREWPLVFGAAEDWYVKPDAGVLMGSPANADPVDPQDVQPEELDIALGIHRIEQMTTLSIRRPARTWAGLRSFVADGDLVGGFDGEVPGFFWLAAQGGYGIQTCAAMGEACASLVCGKPLPPHIADWGLTAAMLSPVRLRGKVPAPQIA